MQPESIQKYIQKLSEEMPGDLWIDRRFTTASAGGEELVEQYRSRGVLREREPKLPEILKHPKLLIVAEPGAGKSVSARAAVRAIIAEGSRTPIFAELKEYRGNLNELLKKRAPAEVLESKQKSTALSYIFDGLDETPFELLSALNADLQALLASQTQSTIVVTSRQAFYVSNRNSLPIIPAVFQILDFSDDDIREYLGKSGVNADDFLSAVHEVDAREEIGNPFVLSVMVQRFKKTGGLNSLRSDNLNYVIQELINSRPRINRFRQRRALMTVAIAMETYSRNELSEAEALQVIKAGMKIKDSEAAELLNELYGSILRRTTNGLAFQARSYGEYLAAEMLAAESLERIRSLAFIDYHTPNESWSNTISYLAELNADVRRLFVQKYPFWMVIASPSAFSPEDRTATTSGILETLKKERQYVTSDPRVIARKLARFVTPETEARLIEDLGSADDVSLGNALVLLGIRERDETISVALGLVKDRGRNQRLRYCAIGALVNAGDSALVDELLPLLNASDPLDTNIADAIGALIEPAQIPLAMPVILQHDAMLSATYYHFRELRSREALVEMLRYMRAQPGAVDSIRARGYVEPVLKLTAEYWDPEIASFCVDILEVMERQHFYPDSNGAFDKLFTLLRKVDQQGLVARLYFERVLARGNKERHGTYYVDRIVVPLMTVDTARWLAQQQSTELIKSIAYLLFNKQIRDILRPHSGGLIDQLEANTDAQLAKEEQESKKRKSEIASLQEKLFSSKTLIDALKGFIELTEEHWPELPDDFREWLRAEISRQLQELKLQESIRWKGTTLSRPQILYLLLEIADRYELRIEPDEPFVFALMAQETQATTNYYRRFGLSNGAVGLLEHLLSNPSSPGALHGIVHFLQNSELWTAAIEAGLKKVVIDPNKDYIQLNALNILAKHGLPAEFLQGLNKTAASPDVKRRAFQGLVEMGHQPTIEQALSQLLNDDAALKSGEIGIFSDSSLDWLSAISAPFAWKKLVELRGNALRLELPQVVGLITNALKKIDRRRAAKVIYDQIHVAPPEWRHAQQNQAIEEERAARVEAAQKTPFAEVLKKIGGSTSLLQVRLICEGPTDKPVFTQLMAQVPDTPDIRCDPVGGWPMLQAKDPSEFLLGCKEAIVVMDGDNGRHLGKSKQPFTQLAKDEWKRLHAAGVELNVLKRYGIENYFPQQVLEKVIGRDLASYFPIPDSVSVIDHFSEKGRSIRFRIQQFLASKIHWIKTPSAGHSLYTKKMNADAAKHILLTDLNNTDLYDVIQHVAERARQNL